MTDHWNWIALGTLASLAIYQYFRVYRVRRESAKREELFQIVTENAADMIALVDVKGRRLYNSPAYKRILGYSSAELGETSAFEQIHPDDRFKVLEAAREARSTGVGKKLEYRIRHKNGTWKVLESVAGTIRDDKGDVDKLVIVNRDVTDRKQAEELAEHNSFHDGLTGLPNRTLFLDRLQRVHVRAQRDPARQFALLFVDLDGFKEINATLGPGAGDQVIVEIGRRLAAQLRTDDTVSRPLEDSLNDSVLSRMGGDEFAILLEAIADPSDAMRAAQRVLATIAEPFRLEGREVHPSASIGISLSTSTHSRPENLLQDADVAMRRAKTLGGSRCEVFDEAMHARAVNRLRLEAGLREAVEKSQFGIHYQPIVQLSSRKITGFEALLRWQHPEQGLISPYKFIDAAEDTGLLFSIGQWLILTACRQLRAWEANNPDAAAVSMHVNLSARQFADARFVTDLRGTIREMRTESSKLQLEMTEAVAAADPKVTVTVLTQLKQLGIGVILDDFGTGNSSLIGLRQFPVDALKIDRSLVSRMLADRGIRDTVDLIITLGHKLKVKVIAEGIETAQHYDLLCELGCDQGQGYLFSQPVDAEAGEQLLRHGLEMYKKSAKAE
jgi:diguanylate cyclase (GGDEF)-like protein/PAS domain S-box-containing protein